MKFTKLVAVFSLMFLVTNCASIIDGSEQLVSVNSNIQGAEVYVNGLLVGKTPFSGKIKKKNNSQVRIQKEGYTTQTITMSTSLPVSFWGNVISGGLLGSTTDYASGAAYEYSPNNYFLHIEKENADKEEKAAAEKANKVTQFVLINHNQLVKEIARGSGEYLDGLIRLKERETNRSDFISQMQTLITTHLAATELAEKITTTL